MDMTPIGDDVPESFQSKLEEYNRNFEHLSDVLGDNNSLTESGAKRVVRAENTKEVLAEALPIAVKTIVGLAAQADSESVRFNAAKLLIDISLGKNPDLQVADPVKDLITRLTGVTESESQYGS